MNLTICFELAAITLPKSEVYVELYVQREGKGFGTNTFLRNYRVRFFSLPSVIDDKTGDVVADGFMTIGEGANIIGGLLSVILYTRENFQFTTHVLFQRTEINSVLCSNKNKCILISSEWFSRFSIKYNVRVR